MDVNQLPSFDPRDNPTGCCPRFHPEGWDGQMLHFDRKPFIRASTVSLFHVPLNMGSVFSRTWSAIQHAHVNTGSYLVLSHDTSAWHAEHLFAVDEDLPGADMVFLTGEFYTKVFEGPYASAPAWRNAIAADLAARGRAMSELYFFYTTCPSCAKVYGKNYVVAVARVAEPAASAAS
jgi:hypothetical protein